MGAEEYNYTRGNTVIAPEIKRQADKSKNRKNKKEEQLNKRKKATLKLISNVIGISSVICTFGLITLSVNGIVYSKQNKLTTIKEEIKVQSDLNDALKVDLLKYSSLETIKNMAENELGMIYPDKDSTITIDMSKDYFSHIKEEEVNNNSFLNKIKEIFN